jgi:hypothetical protein
MRLSPGWMTVVLKLMALTEPVMLSWLGGDAANGDGGCGACDRRPDRPGAGRRARRRPAAVCVTDSYIHLHDAAESIRELPAKNLGDPDRARTMRRQHGCDPAED